jgi:hypothetical protein
LSITSYDQESGSFSSLLFQNKKAVPFSNPLLEVCWPPVSTDVFILLFGLPVFLNTKYGNDKHSFKFFLYKLFSLLAGLRTKNSRYL